MTSTYTHTHFCPNNGMKTPCVHTHTHTHTHRRRGSDFFFDDVLNPNEQIIFPQNVPLVYHELCVCARVCMCVRGWCLCSINSFKKQLKFVKPGLKHFLFCEAVCSENQRGGRKRSRVKSTKESRLCTDFKKTTRYTYLHTDLTYPVLVKVNGKNVFLKLYKRQTTDLENISHLFV